MTAQIGDGGQAPGTRDTATLSEIARLLWERKFLVAAPAALAAALALSYIAVTPRLYTGTTSLLVDPRYGRGLGFENQLNPLSGDLTLIESQVKIISSQNVLRRAVKDQRLTSDSEFSPRPSRLSSILGLGGEPMKPADLETAALLEFARYVTVKRSERTYVIDVTASSMDPSKAARLADAVARAYISDQIEAKSDAARNETGWIRAKLQELQGRLQEAETKVEVYKERNKIYGSGGKLVNEQQLTEATNELTQARTKTSEFKAKHDQVQALLRSGRELESVPEALKSPAVDKLRGQAAEIAREEANLRTTLGPRHPRLLEVQQQRADTRRLITEELRRVGEAARNEYNAARAAEQALEAQLDNLKRGSSLTNQSLVALRELDRDVEMHRAAFDKFSKAQDLVQQQSAEIPVARIIASAIVPVAPTSPRRIPIMALSLAGGIGVGIALALLAGRRAPAPQPLAAAGPRLAAQREPVAGALPWAGPPRRQPARSWALGRKAVPPALEQNPELFPVLEAGRLRGSAFAKAAHDLYLVTAAQRTGRAPFSVLVTSEAEGAGKTVTAAALAFAAAHAGERVLLVDGNHQNPSLTRLAFEAGETADISTAGGRSAKALALGAGASPRVPVSPQADALPRRDLTQPDWMNGEFTLVIVDGAALRVPGLLSLAHSVDAVLAVGPPDTDAGGLVQRAARELLIEPGRVIGAVIVLSGEASDARRRAAA